MASIWQEITEALSSAFPTYADLRRMFRFGMSENLEEVVSNNANLREATFQLLQWAEAAGRTDELILAARNEQPRNLRLRAVAEKRQLAPASRLESVFGTGARLLHIEPFIHGLSACELCVCRIELKGEGIGTGFLIGPQLVMTCFHVAGAAAMKDVAVRFDYKLGRDRRRLSAGVVYSVSTEGVVCSSPTNQLDYLVIALSSAAGDDPVGGQEGAPARHWLNPIPHDFKVSEKFFAIKHPDGTPMKLSVGEVENVCDEGRLVCHNADTLPGSSGSPCFTTDWELVALHRQGLDETGPCKQNAGINIAHILEQEAFRKLLQ